LADLGRRRVDQKAGRTNAAKSLTTSPCLPLFLQRQYLREGGEAAGPENAFNFIRDLRDYWDDVDEALVHLCEERKYEKIILMGDSTGGLTATSYLLFAGDRPGHSLVKMCILNSPLLKFNAARLNRLARGVVRIVGAVAPQLVLVRDDANPKKIVTRRKGPLRMRKEVLRVEPEDYWFDQVCALHGHKYDPILQSPSEGKKPVYSGYVRACLSMMRRIVSAHKKEGKTIPIPAVLFTPNTDVYLERLASKSSPGGQATVPPFTEAMDQSVQLAERPDKTLHVDPHIDVRGVEALFDTLFPNGKRRAFERANHEVLMSEWNVIDSVMELIRDTAEDAGIV